MVRGSMCMCEVDLRNTAPHSQDHLAFAFAPCFPACSFLTLCRPESEASFAREQA